MGVKSTITTIISIGFSLLLLTTNSVFSESTDFSLPNHKPLPYFDEWPQIQSAIPKRDYIEERVSDIVAQMTLGEKVGQMIMPEYRQITPEEAKLYKIGSVLNGGGGWPNENKHASAMDWALQSDQYWIALDEAYAGRGFKVPFLWATDAVHGNNNVYGATLFPHNIGLGAANNPELLFEIGRVTAKEVAATGLDLTFAPTVATPRDYRWGRVYEGYSEIPDITYQYASAIVQGLQGNEKELRSETQVLSTVKHWLGDGGTYNGVDRGINYYTEDHLRNIHAMGYFSALEAGAQVVMTSFNSWQNNHKDKSTTATEISNDRFGKLHGSHYLITDVLKEKMGFDGIVVTDWNGHGEVKGCTNMSCPKAVNAGNDLFMVTDNKDWKAFYKNVIKQVKDGQISMERIDDAVTRILRVKMRAGLWEKPRPSYRRLAGEQQLLGAIEHRKVARQAVSESLVLLKNENQILPFKQRNQSYLVVGSAANDLQKQTGGWTLTWQGNENKSQDFVNATTTLDAFREMVGDKYVYTAVNQAPMDAIAVVVIGEDPYAEMYGDIKAHQTLAYSELKPSYAKDLQLIERLKKKGFIVVTILFSGRPLYINPELALSDAFVAAWLPGTEGGGITDVLFAKEGADFTGKLSYSWPNSKCMTTINQNSQNIPHYQVPEFEQDTKAFVPLFPYGYGLNYSSKPKAPTSPALFMDKRQWGCGETKVKDRPTTDLEIFNREATTTFVPKMSGQVTKWKGTFISRSKKIDVGSASSLPLNYKHQQDALRMDFGKQLPMQFYLQTPDKRGIDMRHYLAANSTLEFDIAVKGEIPMSLKLATHCVYPCGAMALIQKELKAIVEASNSEWVTMKVPLRCFADNGVNFSSINTPFLLYSDEPFEFDIGEIRYVPSGEEVEKEVVDCDIFKSI
ncbi:1,4-beta-D-glucan glucohydrolase [Aliivibrio sp. 1S165]|uniref:glycoside hydrolase family 3 protein n=1 Tax=unclassified Aliivibrio TaxID=2645654 RepID=UPI00080E153A|nr:MULTISPECIES: glycoside hydrolase family 3 protein [unclassified Aliivibrio]OCH18914.1 1,4-beta-D-glucan glucohydrolase [Aliivibrio sp. 1S165]OCH30892.1 1,4-beta-D-glucan glucohydrolase [Aliivibrio sp. 1S175]